MIIPTVPTGESDSSNSDKVRQKVLTIWVVKEGRQAGVLLLGSITDLGSSWQGSKYLVALSAG